METAKYEAGLKSTEMKRTLIKMQRYIKECQTQLKNMESDTLVRTNELSEIMTQYAMMQKQLSDGSEELESMIDDDPVDVDLAYVRELIKSLETMHETIVRQKKQISDIKVYLDKSNDDIKRIVSGIRKAKKQFDDLKVCYDTEVASSAPELAAKKKQLAELASQVDAEMMRRYERIKKNRRDPIALIIDKKCSGCNMALPSGDINAYENGRMLECENCGRILIMREE